MCFYHGTLFLWQNTTLSRDQYGVAYLPGFVGLNNLKCTDFVNVSATELPLKLIAWKLVEDDNRRSKCKILLKVAFVVPYVDLST